MEEPATALREGFEDAGFDVTEASVNRGQIRVVLLTEHADASELESIVRSTVDESDLLGVNVTTEAIDGRDAIGTVVSVRRRR